MAKRDTGQIEATATAFVMDDDERRDFGRFTERSKVAGDGGTRNQRGDYTWAEPQEKAREFLGLDTDH